MSAFEVLDRHGAAALLGFLLAVTAFLLLHLVRLPLLLLARGLEAVMRGLDRRLTTAIRTRPEGDRP